MNLRTSKLSFLGRGAWAIGIAGLAGGLIAYVLVPVLPSPKDKEGASVEVRMLGQPLPLDDRAMRLAMDRVRRYAATNIQLELPEGKAKELSLGRLGAQIDKLHLTALVRDARDSTSLMRRTFAQRGRKLPLELPVPLVLDPTEATRELLRFKDEADRVPTDARMDLEKRELSREVEGRLLDVDRTYLAIEQAVARGERKAAAVFETLKPRRVASELANVKFSHILGYFETRYDRSDKARDRTYNLRLAASKLDGRVLLPGEIFDFNDAVGPRDEANGYRVAPVIAEGELVDGIGGGTCQVSGTLHGAVFFAGLEILERIPHTRPSSYIKMGLDATVVYPTIGFRFKNAFDFPVVLHETVKNGVVRAEILGPERKHTVTFIRKISEAIPYEQIEREDDRLPRGVRVLGQRGVPGFVVTRYRIFREGPHATRERWTDRYPPTPQIVRVGTADLPKDATKADDDAHPEYLADELLVMTQSSEEVDANQQDGLDPDDTPSPGRSQDGSGATMESRQAGRTGVAGWTKEQKMPQWDADNHPRREQAREQNPEQKPENTKRSATDLGRPADRRDTRASDRQKRNDPASPGKDTNRDAGNKRPGRSNREQ